MKLLDLSEISLSSTVSFSAMQLVETLILGSDTHTEQSIGSYAPLTSLNCGEMPFLVSLDIRNTQIATLVTDKCPRIAHINASGSKLENLTLAETSPINDISLPATMTSIRFVGLPELTYTGLSAPACKSNPCRTSNACVLKRRQNLTPFRCSVTSLLHKRHPVNFPCSVSRI